MKKDVLNALLSKVCRELDSCCKYECMGVLAELGEHSRRGPKPWPASHRSRPVSHQSAEVDIAVYDLAKCRRAPDANGKTEVFYQFGFRNLSQIDAAFGFEVILFNDLM
jgi:hypothetical protein